MSLGDLTLTRILQCALALGEKLVPSAGRSEWCREWRAELWHSEHGGLPVRSEGEQTLSLAYGIIADAAWLRVDWLRDSARASAYTCLWVLGAYSLLCVLVERVAEGSWRAFIAVLTARFLGSFAFVMAPAIFAAIVTYPLRPLRCNGAHGGTKRILSTRTRWNLFLGAKISLTLLLGFLATVVATEPARTLAGTRLAWAADWLELMLSALVVTASLRWALLDQEQRCQKCLRTLRQPTRVGPPSRNFLEWSGTALACEDGHGRLHVPEMDGSWCWYDLWVELDAGLAGIFGGRFEA
jgi:hypothetical protein